MVAKRIKGLLLGLSLSSRHSGGSTLAESYMLGHADTNDGERSYQLRRFWLLTQELGQDLPINCTSAQGGDIILYCWIMREICQIMILGLEHTSFTEVVSRYFQTSEYDPSACQVLLVTNVLSWAKRKVLRIKWFVATGSLQLLFWRIIIS